MLDLLHEHYKFNIDRLKSANNQRDLMFFLLILSVMLIVVQSINIDFINSIIINYIKVDKDSLPGNALLLSTFWLTSLVLFIRYSQYCLFIDMQYKYIAMLESEINKNYQNTKIFLFESEIYKSHNNCFRKMVGFFYKKAFPLSLILIIIFKIVTDFRLHNIPNAYLYLNVAFAVIYVIYLIAYILRK
ncbi:hypothetical protein M0J18_RS19720 [Morganella morganii]|nr:hypothetical protein [Morganella morganii]